MVFCIPSASSAWGTEGHRSITRRALDALPQPLREFFSADGDFVVAHVIDPDLWRILDLEGRLGAEGPNHYLDIDGLGEPRPFSRVPRDRRAFLAKYGTSKANDVGRLPWQAADVYGRLVTSLRNAGRNSSAAAATDARYLAAVLAHYVEDAHVPFHASENHDGQLSGQRGIHARFESDLVRRNAGTLALAPVRVDTVGPILDVMFETLVASEASVATILEADRRAARGSTAYDDGYYRRFFQDVRAILQDRLSRAASSVASVLVSAWQAAGSPALSGRGGRR
jgi:hypothetical protein